FREPQLLKGLDSIGLKSAECVGQLQPEPAIDLIGDLNIDAATFGRRLAGAVVRFQISAARYYVGLPARSRQLDDSLRLVLAVAIDGHQHFVAMSDGIIEGRTQRGAVAAVLRM